MFVFGFFDRNMKSNMGKYIGVDATFDPSGNLDCHKVDSLNVKKRA